MKHSFLDKYSRLDSPIHRRDPRAKIVAFLAALLIIVTEPRGEIRSFLFYYLLIALVLIISRVPVLYVLKRCLIVSPFVLMAAGLMLLSGTPVGGEVEATLFGARAMLSLSIALKAFAAVVLLTLLTSTERFHRLLEGLRSLKMPTLLGVLSAFMYRYVFILSDEMMRTTRARMSRTPGRLTTSRFTTYGNQAATIFIRSWERSQIVYDAMCSRGFRGSFPLRTALDFRWPDAFFLASFALVFIAVRVFA